MSGSLLSNLGLADALVTSLLNEGAGHHFAFDTAMTWIALGAVPVIVLSVAVQWWLHDDCAIRRHTAVASGLAFVLALGINQIVLLAFDRTRPYDAHVSHLIIAPSADPSFPSDHATAAFAVAFSFLLLGWRREGLAYFAMAALVAFSRVYVGIHYLGDVMGGAVTALLAAVTVMLLFRPGSMLSRRLVRIL